MPTYDYECGKCKYRFELFQKMTDKPINSCPKCGSNVDRLIGSGSGIIFKGSGFYETDYKRKKEEKVKPDVCKGCPAAKEKKCEQKQ